MSDLYTKPQSTNYETIANSLISKPISHVALELHILNGHVHETQTCEVPRGTTMKHKFPCLVLLLGLSIQAQATVIGFNPSDQQVGINGTTTVELVISDLGDDILTGFDLSIFFDDTILAFDGFEFGTDCLGFSCLDVLGFDANVTDVTDWGFGEVEVFELSFDLDEDLELFQPDEFVLGTFTFTGIDFGTSALDIFVWELSGAFVFDEDLGDFVASSLDADVESGSIEVPEPGTLLLLISGLLGIALCRRNRAVVRA